MTTKHIGNYGYTVKKNGESYLLLLLYNIKYTNLDNNGSDVWSMKAYQTEQMAIKKGEEWIAKKLGELK